MIGNAEKTSAATFLEIAGGELARVRVNDIASVRETARHMVAGFGGRARAYVEVQNGCDHRCTFCVIPYGRGPSRSVPAGDVVRQVRALAEEGYREVVMTGVDLTSYGAGLPGGMSLGRLVRTDLAARAGTAALAAFLDRHDRGGQRVDRCVRGRGAADAASASLAAIGRQSHSEAHEAAARARGCHSVLHERARAATRHGIRRRLDRGLPDRGRGDVRQYAPARATNAA